MLRTILFDLGNVLLHFSHQRMCRQIGNLVGKSEDEVWDALFAGGLLGKLETGSATPDQFQVAFEQRLGVRFDPAELHRASSDIFTLNEPLRPALDELKDRGLRLVLLSNTSVPHYEWIRERYDVLAPFDELVLSYEVGATKPTAAIFERALEAIQCQPHECFYTDDIEAYVLRGRDFGLHAEVFTETDQFLQHLARHGLELDPGRRPGDIRN